MFFIYLIICGVIIGSAMMAPGVSGGVFAVILGLYDRMIYSLTNLFKDFKKNFSFLFFLGVGILIGSIYISKILLYLYTNYEIGTKFLFIGLILGGIPCLYKNIIIKKDSVNVKVIIITMIISLILLYLSNNTLKININSSNNLQIYFNMFLAGIFYSIGKIIPGVSGSFLLMLLGVYEYLLNIVANPLLIKVDDTFKLIPFVIGLILGIIVLLKIINYLLKNKFGLTYSIIIGFIIGTIPLLIPKITKFTDFIIALITFIIGFLASLKLSKLEK